MARSLRETHLCEDGFIINEDKMRLRAKCWNPQGGERPRALLFIAHGAGEHCGRYDDIANPLSDLSVLVFAHDHAGHGCSDGPRCQIDSYSQYVRDVFRHIDMMKDENPNTPIYIYGHSMGGAIAILCVLERPNFFSGLILSSPLIKVASPANWCQILSAKILVWICPRYEVMPGVNTKHLSHDPDEVKKYEDDVLIYHGDLKCNFCVATMNAMSQINKQLHVIDIPFLVQHGDDDKICSVEGSILLQKRALSRDKTIKIYEGAYHEILNESDNFKKPFIEKTLNWMSERLSHQKAERAQEQQL